MRSHETHRAGASDETAANVETASDTVSAAELPLADRFAALDSIFVETSRTGLPVPMTRQFTMENVEQHLDAINSAWFSDCLAQVGAETGGEGSKSPGKYSGLSADDKLEYGRLRANGGGVLHGADGKPVLHKGDQIAVSAFRWAPVSRMSLAEEAIDRVRHDYLAWCGMVDGEYDDHKTQAKIDARAKARAAIRGVLNSVPSPFPGKTENGKTLPPKEGYGDGKTYADLVFDMAQTILNARGKPRVKNMAQPKTEDVGV